MKQLRNAFAVLMMLVAVSALAQPAQRAEYRVLNPPQPTSSGEKIEVLEFFFYGCVHCFNLQRKLASWAEHLPSDVQLNLVPAHLNQYWEPMAYTYYALNEMGKLKALHEKLYDAWHIDHMVLVDSDSIFDFVARQGVDRQQFVNYYSSFFVRTKVEQSKRMMRQYHIEATPTLIVDGKYSISGLQPDDMMRVLNELIVKARAERAKHE